MKRLILIFAVLGIINSSAFSATFTLKYGSTNLSSISIQIYQNGKQVTSGSTSSTGTVSFTLPTGNYSYKTATNFIGDITASSTVTLDHKKVTFTVKDNAGNPISSETIRIYEDGVEVANKSTNASGIAEFYLKPSDKYAYKTSFAQAAFSLQNDVSFNLTKNNVSVIAKYQNYPVADNFTLYPYSDRNTSLATAYSSATNGEVNFNVATGKYWLKNKLNIYTELNITNSNQQILLDYKKVRFISNETAPNILENVVVSNGTYSTDTKITDGKGYADFYLLPGSYTYSHLGMSQPFTVVNDMTINLTTQTVTFNLRNGTTSAAYANQPFKIGKDMSSLSSYITNSSGTCEVNLSVGSYIFSDGFSSYPFTISGSGETIIPPLYDVTFNIAQNLSGVIPDYVYVTSINTGKTVTYNPYTEGMKVCLLSGDYNFYCYSANGGFSSSHKIPFTVNQNTTVQGLYTFQLNVKDNNNTAISGISYYIKQDGGFINTSFTTNNQGVAIAFLPNGNYQLYNTKTQEETPFAINNQNNTLNLQLPNERTLNVTKDGQAITTGYVMIYNEQKTSVQSVQIINGIGKVRLQSGSNYYVMMSVAGAASMQQKIAISGSNMNLDFVSLQIKSEGKGIAFPYQTDDYNLVYYLKQSTIRLAAVPMKGWTCTKWTINGTNINDDLIDYTLNGATVATAIFEQNLPSGVAEKRASSNNLTIYPNPAETQINFSEDVSGNGYIYSSGGNLAKQIYVFGNGINISDLSSGVYVLVIETESQSYKGSFIKK
ncbi:MAG: T9SS type A sorting domain-containing protein [Paludibacteraceae bacterium]|nr:T9SS type A sorting domain-containing protein [Paludibacteraceae bacterium]